MTSRIHICVVHQEQIWAAADEFAPGKSELVTKTAAKYDKTNEQIDGESDIHIDSHLYYYYKG